MSKADDYKQYYRKQRYNIKETILLIIFIILILIMFGAIVYGFIKVIYLIMGLG